VRLIAAAPATTQNDLPAQAIVCHDVRNPAQRNEVVVRKGALLSAPEIAALLTRGIAEVHLAVPESGDVGEDEAASRLAAAVAGPAVDVSAAQFGQVSFTSAVRGVVRVDVSVLHQVNEHPEVLLLTSESDRPVEVGMTLGVIKCAPLYLPESTLVAVEAIVAETGPVLDVEPFRPMRVALVAPAERLRGGALQRAHMVLGHAFAWYGSSLETLVAAEATKGGMSDAYRQVLKLGVDLILAAGATATDPLDVVFDGLRQAGGEVEQIGIHAEPGTACWIGHLASTPVLGLASCELFGQPGALDLILPRVLTGEPLDRELVRRLAHGGLLLGPSRVAPHHARGRAAD
jgi:hypothetical protein